MNIIDNTNKMLRDTLQCELREFAQFCEDQGINPTLAATMALNQCLAAGAAVAEQSFRMGKDAYLKQAGLVWDLYQDAKAKSNG